MIWKLLRKNISAGQILGYALANFIGLAIVITALRFYNDAAGALGYGDKDEALAVSDYLVLSRPVSMLNTFRLGASSDGISASEIKDLEKQPWAEAVGEFSSANFSVTAGVEYQGKGLWTYMFLESVPDRFIDNLPEAWKFDPEKGLDQEVPIILSKDYLSLYNFGFAASRGFPQVTESMVSTIPITLYLNGKGHSEKFTARIVGFSSRLNTVAVPEAFMEWANDRYATSPNPQPSRLIVEVNDPGNPDIAKYLDKHDFEVAGDRIDQGKTAYILKLVTAVVVVIGAVISVLALFILMLSISLLLQKNKEKNRGLLLLGYSPIQVSCAYFKLVGFTNLIVLALAVAAMLVAASIWGKMLSQAGLSTHPSPAPIFWGCAIILAITAINFTSIYRSVRKAYFES